MGDGPSVFSHRFLVVTRGLILLLLMAHGECRAGKPAGSSLPADAQLRLDQSGAIQTLKAANLSAFLEEDPAFRERVRAGQWAEASLYFLRSLGPLVRLEEPERELMMVSLEGDELGFRHVRLRQQVGGLPVWESEIIVHWNPHHAIYLVTGDYLPTPSGLSLQAGLDAQAALRKAELAVSVSCAGCVPELGILRGRGTAPRLAYRVRIPQRISQVWMMTVDAHSGEVLEHTLVPR